MRNKQLVFAVLLLAVSGAICQQVPIEDEVAVSYTGWGPSAAELNETVALVLESCQARELLHGSRYRVLSSEFTSDPMSGYGDNVKSSINFFQTTVYDYLKGLTIKWRGIPLDASQIFSTVSNTQPLTNAEEVLEAAILAGHRPNSGEVVGSSMPPVITREFPDGTSHRILNIVVTSNTSSKIFEVNMNNGTVETPVPSTHNTAPTCSSPLPAGQWPSGEGLLGTANFVITQGGQTLWTFQAIRPSSSSGLHKSGIELRNVKYKGKTVLYRAHVPILNIEYEQKAFGCGPYYRDWQYDEFWFKCDPGSEIPGFRKCGSPPKTILDTNVDGGNFRGVAVSVEGKEVVLKSVLSAGWYRYVSEWRFDVDGTLRPRWGFAGVLQGSNCVCVPHNHHVYWRFDFDIETAGNNLVREFNDPPIIGTSNYHDKVFEIRRPKDQTRHRHWEISNTRTNRRYALIPGPTDGTSTAFGVGDVWVLQYHGTELDDGFPSHVISGSGGQVMAHLDKFLTGEGVKDKDVVMWYAAHFRHVHGPGGGGGGPHIVGPEIRPIKW